MIFILVKHMITGNINTHITDEFNSMALKFCAAFPCFASGAIVPVSFFFREMSLRIIQLYNCIIESTNKCFSSCALGKQQKRAYYTKETPSIRIETVQAKEYTPLCKATKEPTN